jgi:hypothetical protein
MICPTVDDARTMREAGLTLIGYSFDTWLLEGALRDGLAALRDG